VFPDAHFLRIQQRRYFPHFSGDQSGKMNEELYLDLTSSIADSEIVVSTVFGNEHNVFGLVNHPRPFDFIPKDEEIVCLDSRAEFVPEKYVYDALKNRTRSNEMLLLKLRQLAGSSRPIYHIQSPPPIPSAEHILSHPEKYGPRLKERGVASKYLRLKLWKLFSHIIQGYCDQSDILFVATPESAQDSEGFLKEKYWGEDATHGNSLFGAKVLEELSLKLSVKEKRN